MRAPGLKELHIAGFLLLVGAFAVWGDARPAHAYWWPIYRGVEVYDAGDWKVTDPYRKGNPGEVAAGDLNGDGRPDLVVANGFDSLNTSTNTMVGGNTVSVLLLDGSNGGLTRFQPKVNYRTGSFPLGVRLVDMNLDGKLDIITRSGVDSVSVLLATGPGTFGPPTTYSSRVRSGGSLGTFAVANVNGDAWPDLLIPGIDNSVNYDRVAVLLGTGGGTLGPVSLVDYYAPPFAFGNIDGFCAGDVTGDGLADILATTQSENTALLLRNNNNGTFTPTSTNIPWGLGIALANLNGDALLDAVGTDGSNVLVSIGSGGGTFAAPVAYPLVSGSPFQLELRDIDSDGAIDAVATTPKSNFQVLRGNGNGTFGAASLYPLQDIAWNLRMVDLNSDAKLDAVFSIPGEWTGGNRSHTVGVLMADPAGGFRTPKLSGPSSGGQAMHYQTSGDFNRDGRADLAVSDSTLGRVRIWLGAGDGTFTETNAYPASGPGTIVAADYNSDGRLDLVVTTQGVTNREVRGYPGNGDGTFVTPGQLFVTFPFVLDPSAVADMNRDGRQDLLLSAASRTAVSIRCRNTSGLYPVTHTITTPDSINAIETGDWNRDGILDLTLARTQGLSLYTGTGNGTMNNAIVVTTGKSYADVCGGDFNRDGALDLAAVEKLAGQSGTRGIDVFLGNGIGGFGMPLSIPTLEQNGWQIACRDADLDGKLDLIVSAYGDPPLDIGQIWSPASVEVHRGDGAGGFGPGYGYSLASTLRDGQGDLPFFSALDVNGDDAPDLVSRGRNFGRIQTLLAELPKRGHALGARTNYPMLPGTGQVAVGDLNRDGILDMVTSTGSWNPGVSIRLGLGGGTFGTFSNVTLNYGAWKADVADMNRDGILDLVSAGEMVSFRPGLGDGTFGAQINNAFSSVDDFQIADMNQDGILDIVAGQSQSSLVTVLLGNGDGTFTPAPSGGSIPSVYDLEVTDVNRDGKLDVVAVANNLFILYGNGDGTLANSVPVTLGTSQLWRLCLADFDRDGFMDVAASDFQSHVFVARGAAVSPFSTYTTVTAPGAINDLEVGHAEADGRTFLYLVIDPTNQLVLFESSLAGGILTFTPAGAYTTALTPAGLVVADLNGDGLPDVMTANSGDNNISVFLHQPGVITGVATVPAAVPRPRLDQNFPNPFNPATTVRYSVPEAGPVRLDVFDVRGRHVVTLVNGMVTAGEHRVQWNGRTVSGSPAASGVYLYRLSTASGHQESKRMVMLK